MKINKILFIYFVLAFLKVNLSLDHCSNQFNDNFCRYCNEGYKLTEEGKCEACTDNKIGMNNHCFSKIENCESYSLYKEGERCEKCKNNYELNEERTRCTECNEDLISDGCDICHKVIENCVYYEIEDDGVVKCNYCISGYEALQDKTKCIPTCEENKIKPFSNCIDKIEGCITYKDDNTCEKCGNYYKLKDNKCVPCPYDEYYKSNGKTCFLQVLGCEEYDDSGNCAYCTEGYKLSSNSCVKNENGSGMNIYNSFNFKINIISLLLIILL